MENSEIISNDVSYLGIILAIFIATFFAVSILAQLLSIIRSRDSEQAKNCRLSAWMSLFMGIFLLYLYFVLI